MPYAIYNGKRVVSGSKYVSGIQPLNPIFSSWTNSTWDTFSSSGLNIVSAIDTASGIALTNYELFTIGDIIEINYNLTLNSGSLPTLRLYNQIQGDIGTGNMIEGSYFWQFTVTSWASMNFAIGFRAAAGGTDCSCTFNIYKK